MLYISYEKLILDIRQNLHKIPKDILGVIGIPRSGMIPASILSESLNVGLCSINEFIKNGSDCFKHNHGNRKIKENNSKKY